jgi:hypothetical protein
MLVGWDQNHPRYAPLKSNPPEDNPWSVEVRENRLIFGTKTFTDENVG